ncbi:MAG: ComEC/Rec2 family competence protein [Bacteroidales bacterium]
MNNWHTFPFVRILIPFILGIITASQMLVVSSIITFACAILLFASFFLIFLKNKIQYRFRWISGVIFSLFLFFIAYEITIQNTPVLARHNISHFTDPGDIIVRITDPVTERPNSFKTSATALLAENKQEWIDVNGNMIIYFEKSEQVSQIQYGDVLIISGSLSEIKPPQNPGEFNYKKYLSNKGIYHSVYVKSKNWQIIKSDQGFWLKSFGTQIRNHLLDMLKSNGIEGDEYAVASAILLGYDENLDADLKRQFAGAGAMHILCVSGLHVGIIYVIFNSILFFLKRNKYLRVLKVVLLILFIWSYATITGFSPSVLRASTMFSFIIIGRGLKRKANIYNMLGASALLLLVINPYMLMEVGFQLSYIAVTGIVLLYKPIYNLWIPTTWVIDKIWQISVVSIAATIATFPLSLFYFHQFPNLFLVTNLVAIPASMLIIYFGLGIIAFSLIPFLSSFFGKLLSFVLIGLNYSVGWIEGLSFATSRGIYINRLELILISLFIISLITLCFYKSKRPLIISTVLMILLGFSFLSRRAVNLKQEKIVVYKVKGATAIDFISGMQNVLLTDTSLIIDPGNLDYNVKGNWTNHGIHKNLHLPFTLESYKNDGLCIINNFILFKNKVIALIDNDNFPIGGHMIEVDYVIVSGRPNLSMKDLRENLVCKEIIFDSSVPYWKVNQWKNECQEISQICYDVNERGARVIDI